MNLTKADILKPHAPEIFPLDIPEWGGTVHVRVPSLRVIEDYEAWQRKLREAGNQHVGLRARVAIMVCCDESGAPLFTSADESALCSDERGFKALDRIVDFISPHLGWVASAIEADAKNSQATTGDDSTTD